MEYHYLFPGSFCPPTFGHLEILEKAAALFPAVQVVCSSNPEKSSRMFCVDECRDMWDAYELPKNVTIKTYREAQDQKLPAKDIIMIRGMRGKIDIENENKVMLYNHASFGINKYFYLFSGSNRYCSSTHVRQLAAELKIDQLWLHAAPLVISKLLEKVLKARNVFMVAGRPGAGKTTFSEKLAAINPNVCLINGDELTRRAKKAAGVDFSIRYFKQLAMNNDRRLLELIGKSWMTELKMALRSVPEGSEVFIEIPYGMCKERKIFRFVGGKVIYVGCREEQNFQRIEQRSTPGHADFIYHIPDKDETEKLAKKYKLSLCTINTSGRISEHDTIALRLNEALIQGDLNGCFHRTI